MISEIRLFDNSLSECYNLLKNNKSHTLWDLVELKRKVNEQSLAFVETINDKVISLPTKNKEEVLNYCLKHLANKSMPEWNFIPWWATVLYGLDGFDGIVGERAQAIESLEDYVDKPKEKIFSLLSDFAKYCEKYFVSTIDTEWQTYGNWIKQADWVVIFKILDNAYLYDGPNRRHEHVESLEYFQMTETTMLICASNAIQFVIESAILKLSKLFAYFIYGSFEYENYPSALRTKWRDSFTIFCNEICMSEHSPCPEHLTDFVLEINEITYVREEDIKRALAELEIPSTANIRPSATDKAPLVWMGKGIELLDLFVSLQEKGFIRLPGTTVSPGPTVEAVCRAICGLFDLSEFRRPDSKGEPWQTLETYFKSRSIDRITKENRYDKLNYNKRKFDDIPPKS
jgi:hypothetical protein